MSWGAWHDDPGAPCRRCGAARSCEHRSVEPPVAPPQKDLTSGAHRKNLRVGGQRHTRQDERPVAANGNLLRVRK
jgi:hypothetical protein